MKLKSILKILNPFYKPKKKKYYSFHRFELEEKREKIYIVRYFIDNFSSIIFQYPFNYYGINDFIWWFKYRLFKEHQYHKIDLGLKPGYHDMSDIFKAALTNKKAMEYIEKLEAYIKEVKSTEEKEEYFKEMVTALFYLKKARKWLTIYLPSISNKLENKTLKGENYRRYINRSKWITSVEERYLTKLVKYRYYLYDFG